MKGYVDRVEGNRVIGWCAPVVSGTPAMVSARIGSNEVATARANIERKDVEEAGVCEARCGFELIVPLRAFDQYGLEFPIALERFEDGAVLAEAVSVDGRGERWIWSPADLAVIVKKWREASPSERAKIPRRLAGFDSADLITALMEYGFFEEVDAVLAAREDSKNADEFWFAIDGESCSGIQIKRWAFECRLREASARARAALLKAEFLDEKIMPTFREALVSNIVEPADWVTLIDLFALCPDATSLREFFQGLIEFLAAKRSGVDQVIEGCLRHGQIDSMEIAAGEAAVRVRSGETVAALCCIVIDCAACPSPAKNINLNSIFSSLEKAARGSPKQNESTDEGPGSIADSFVWPIRDGLRWPYYEMPKSKISVKLSLFLFVTDTVLPEACHDSVLSILNQASQGLRLLIIGNTERLPAKTHERLDRCEGVEVCFFSKNLGNIDLLREAAEGIVGDYVGWLEVGEIISPGILESIESVAEQNRGKLGPAAFVFDTVAYAGAKISTHCSASHLSTLSIDRLSRIEEDWLEHQFLSDGWLLVAPDLFAESLRQLPAMAGPDALQYALCFSAVSHREPIRHIGKTGLFKPLPLQPVEPLHTQEIIQQSEQRSFVIQEPLVSPAATKHFRELLSKHFNSGVPRITIMSSRLDKIFSLDTAREIREHFTTLGYQADFVEEINPNQIVPGQLILILVHQYGAETDLIPLLAKRFPDCPLIGWFWDNHHQALGNVEIARYFHACIAAHDFCCDVLVSRRNVLLPSVPLCVTQWTATEAKKLFAKYGHGERSKSLYGGFVRYATATRRNDFVMDLQNHLAPHALSLVDEFNLAAYFALPADERFSEWCQYRTSLCLPLYHDLSQRFFDALLCGQLPIVTDDIVDMDQTVLSHPELVKRFEILTGYDINGLNLILEDANRQLDIDPRITPAEQHKYALNHHMFQNRIETILSSLKVFAKAPSVEVSTINS